MGDGMVITLVMTSDTQHTRHGMAVIFIDFFLPFSLEEPIHPHRKKDKTQSKTQAFSSLWITDVIENRKKGRPGQAFPFTLFPVSPPF